MSQSQREVQDIIETTMRHRERVTGIPVTIADVHEVMSNLSITENLSKSGVISEACDKISEWEKRKGYAPKKLYHDLLREFHDIRIARYRSDPERTQAFIEGIGDALEGILENLSNGRRTA